MTAASSIREANLGQYDLYLALHSNASGAGSYGENRGIIAFYYPGSSNGRRAAELIAEQLRQIYPLPNQVTTRATTSLGEVRQPRFPAVLVEIGYHDNYDDAVWLEGHWDAIAQQLARALTEYFGLPFIYPMEPVSGTVAIQYRDAEPAGLPLFRRRCFGESPRRCLCHGLRRVGGLVCGALRRICGLRGGGVHRP